MKICIPERIASHKNVYICTCIIICVNVCVCLIMILYFSDSGFAKRPICFSCISGFNFSTLIRRISVPISLLYVLCQHTTKYLVFLVTSDPYCCTSSSSFFHCFILDYEAPVIVNYFILLVNSSCFIEFS